jgi:RNA 2',3'-cyclic 3'-phosphodiesterase
MSADQSARYTVAMSDNTLRLFLAVNIPDPPRAAIDAVVAPLGASMPQVRWVRPELWHFTLVFLGQRPAEQSAALCAAAGSAASAVPVFRLGLGGPGVFPGAARPRVLWVGVDLGAASLEHLQRAVLHALVAAGLAQQEERFSAHLTVGRLRDTASQAERAEAGRRWLAAPLTAAAPFDVRSVDLMRSETGPGGSHYTTLATLPLAPPGD